MDEIERKRLLTEGRRIEESATWSAQNQLEQAKIWRNSNYIIGIPSTSLGAVAGAATLATTIGRLWAGLATLAAAALTAMMTLLNLAKHTDEALVAGNAYLAVQQDARQYCQIDLHTFEYDEARQQLGELTARLQEVNKSAPLVSRRAYQHAKKNIERGSQSYRVDIENSSNDG